MAEVNPQASVLSAVWLEQAHHDLEVAQQLRGTGAFAWSCFAAQQSGEKALKAVRIAMGDDLTELKKPWDEKKNPMAGGHNVTALLRVRYTAPLRDAAAYLTEHEQSTRYPEPTSTALPPFRKYSEKKADDAIAHAITLVDFADRMTGALATFWTTM